jgi:hypothetical protein
MAHALEKKGDWQGALLELEVGLRGISDKFTQSAFRLLVRYATIAAEHQMGVPLVYRDLFLESARSWGISVPELFADPGALGQTILSADVRWREAQDRYITLLDALRAHREKSSRRELIQDYIDQEPLGYFRMMAQEMLEEGRDPSDKAPGKLIGVSPAEQQRHVEIDGVERLGAHHVVILCCQRRQVPSGVQRSTVSVRCSGSTIQECGTPCLLSVRSFFTRSLPALLGDSTSATQSGQRRIGLPLSRSGVVSRRQPTTS